MSEHIAARDERQRQVLRYLVERLADGVTPEELAEAVGIRPLYAAVLLSRMKRQGIVVKRDTSPCRYCISPKGERKLAWLEAKKQAW